jgi:ferredoxin
MNYENEKLNDRFVFMTTHKLPKNVAGKYYVNDNCIDCDMCREFAPANFARDDEGDGLSFVFKQPGTLGEEAQCKEAKEGCPAEAISDDGGID